MNEPRIIIVIKGGLVQQVYSNIPISCDVLDYDNLEQETDTEEINRLKDLEIEILTLPKCC